MESVKQAKFSKAVDDLPSADPVYLRRFQLKIRPNNPRRGLLESPPRACPWGINIMKGCSPLIYWLLK